MQNTSQSIAKLVMQVSQLATSVSEYERCTFLSQLISNIRKQNTNSNQAHVVQDSNFSQMNVITTLRSGKQINNQIVNPNDLPKISSKSLTPSTESNSNTKSNSKSQSSLTQVDGLADLRSPFPHRLHAKKHSDK